MHFANKEYFLLLLLLIPYVLWYFLYKRKMEPSMRMSDTFPYRFATIVAAVPTHIVADYEGDR